MDQKDKTSIQNLAKEGKRLSKIVEEDYPQYEYLEIYGAVNDGGGQSALGAKRSIANRLSALVDIGRKQERIDIINEIDDLVWHLYESLKSSQNKLQSIRAILDK